MGQKVWISLFGRLIIRCDTERVIDIEARRAQELLCYLLLFRDRLHEREKVATLMWGDKSTTRSRQYLRQALWQVQTSFNDPELRKEVLLIERDWIGINPQAIFWLDVSIFAQTYARVERIPGSALAPEQIPMLQEALQLYQGDLLEGWYEDWCILERERYQNMYLAILDKLLNYCETYHEYESGLAYGAQILRYDRARERTHRSLMTLHSLAGHRDAAVHQFNLCVAALKEELGVGPAESTVALYRQICNGHMDGQAQTLTKTVVLSESMTTPLSSALLELEQINKTLHQIQNQVNYLTEMLGQQYHT